MERLYFPPSLRYLDPLRVIPREPTEHLSFAYDLVEAVRPRLVTVRPGDCRQPTKIVRCCCMCSFQSVRLLIDLST